MYIYIIFLIKKIKVRFNDPSKIIPSRLHKFFETVDFIADYIDLFKKKKRSAGSIDSGSINVIPRYVQYNKPEIATFFSTRVRGRL